jgi:Protein of unknown function (DUF3710)
VKFRRKKSPQVEGVAVDPAPANGDMPTGDTATDVDAPAPADLPEVAGARAQGPWDSSEVDLEEEDATRVDLGALVVKGRPGFELRLQVDEASQQVAAVLLVGEEGAVELRPFAAPRNGDIWTDVRRQIAAETARRGGTATEVEGPHGPELQVAMPARTPDGQAATQPSRVVGIPGPRWLLRATFLGRPAVSPDPDGDLESAVRDVVVVRGGAPMAPGEPLPLVMPSDARPVPGQGD